uniref:hypothetical protein n=1 Tax=uncultured Allobacillus sp. TaxID=1638025 RepID=UPI002593F26A|nr:hypothetical protein [uncultured Allobacillus sp.]
MFNQLNKYEVELIAKLIEIGVDKNEGQAICPDFDLSLYFEEFYVEETLRKYVANQIIKGIMYEEEPYFQFSLKLN